eukprot:TRINITY_DN23710_c0_g3_i1.p1 TRINITY_DN23710_c0_g3~~TRINITY_DN23710_c0_g3_i1.p1  ORF type:complete len:355 (+),score=88.27 TRINITY_DN23710_c0_g3_i1:287-1351(+)
MAAGQTFRRRHRTLAVCLLAGLAAVQTQWLLGRLAQVPAPAEPVSAPAGPMTDPSEAEAVAAEPDSDLTEQEPAPTEEEEPAPTEEEEEPESVAEEMLEALGMADFLESYSWIAGLSVAFGSYLICSLQKEVQFDAPPPFEKRSDFERMLFVNAWLALMSGIVNAVAFLEMGMTVSHHTGNSTHMGRMAGVDGTKFMRLIGSFMAGAATLGANQLDAEAPYAGRFSPALLATAFAVVGAFSLKYFDGSSLVCCQLLAFSQGIMNALTRKCASMPLCVSHVTGYVTDAGAILGTWVNATMTGRTAPSLKKPSVFIASVAAFSLGGFVTAVWKDSVGASMLLLSAAGTSLMAVGVC